MIVTEKLVLKKLEFKDALDLSKWGVHEDERFTDYNLSDMDVRKSRIWYKYKSQTKSQIYFSMRTADDKLVGYIGLKEYNPETKSAYLGIVIDPNEVNKGYGKESINALVEYAFDVYGLEKVYLKVNNFNKRAMACYTSCGFVDLYQYEEEFENQKLDIEDEDFDEFFVVKDGVIFSKNTVMVIDNKR